MNIIYTKHAIDKLKTSEAKKFQINKKKIEFVVRNPISQVQLPFGVIRLIGKLGIKHSLCVIIKNKENVLKVITFFPIEKGRYENKVLS